MSEVVTHCQASPPSGWPRAIIMEIVCMTGSEADGLTSAEVIALVWSDAVPDDGAMIDGV